MNARILSVSRQCGAMVLLKRLQEKGHIRLDYVRVEAPAAWPQPASIPMTLASIPMTTASIPMTLAALDALRRATGVEKVLPYDHRIVPQETGYWCGPSSAQVVLNSRGIVVEERVLAREIGTDEGGTDFVELSERVLDRRVPQARYTSVDMPNDPPSPAQRERLWRDLVRSIDAGWGVIMNWVAPPWNYARGVKGSISPAYHGGWVYHYVAAMATTTPRARGRCGSPTPASAASGTGAASTRSRPSSRRRPTRTPTPPPDRRLGARLHRRAARAGRPVVAVARHQRARGATHAPRRPPHLPPVCRAARSQTDRLPRPHRSGHLRDRHVPLPRPARRGRHHPRRPKGLLAHRRDLAVGHRDLPSMATTSGRLPLTTRPTRPYRPKEPGPGKPAHERHRPTRHTHMQKSTPKPGQRQPATTHDSRAQNRG